MDSSIDYDIDSIATSPYDVVYNQHDIMFTTTIIGHNMEQSCQTQVPSIPYLAYPCVYLSRGSMLMAIEINWNHEKRKKHHHTHPCKNAQIFFTRLYYSMLLLIDFSQWSNIYPIQSIG